MIQDDASFLVGLHFATSLLPNKSNIPYLFSSVNYDSLIMFETYNYYVKHDTVKAAQLQHAYADEIKQSRQRVKLYDDKKLGIEGIGKTLLETITKEHQKELSKKHKIKLPKWAWKDIGIYFVEGIPHPISTTHLASFNMGIGTLKMFDITVAKEFGQELGKFFVTIAKNKSMLVRLPALNIVAQDIRSEKLYTRKKYGSSLKNINAGLSIIEINSNFMALCLPPSAQHPPIFKWKFLTAYHVISSLRMIRHSNYARTITGGTLKKIDKVLDTDFARLMETESAVALRNTLTHYGIDSRIDTSELNLNSRKLYGIVEGSLPGETYEELAKKLDLFIEDTLLNMFDAW